MFEAPGLPEPWRRRIVGAHKASDELRGREGADDVAGDDARAKSTALSYGAGRQGYRYPPKRADLRLPMQRLWRDV